MPQNGVWTDDLIDDVFAWGTAERVATRAQELFDIGAEEVLIRPIGAGPNATQVLDRTIRSIAAAFD
jgi:hypothetical protein